MSKHLAALYNRVKQIHKKGKWNNRNVDVVSKQKNIENQKLILNESRADTQLVKLKKIIFIKVNIKLS